MARNVLPKPRKKLKLLREFARVSCTKRTPSSIITRAIKLILGWLLHPSQSESAPRRHENFTRNAAKARLQTNPLPKVKPNRCLLASFIFYWVRTNEKNLCAANGVNKGA